MMLGTKDQLPATYTTLTTTHLEEEPNLFEQSFENATTTTLNETKRPSKYNVQDNVFVNHSFTQQPKRRKSTIDKEERKNFLERNRIAALKCRQRKKQWLENLQVKVDYLANENERLHIETDTLQRELIELKAQWLQHKQCQI